MLEKKGRVIHRCQNQTNLQEPVCNCCKINRKKCVCIYLVYSLGKIKYTKCVSVLAIGCTGYDHCPSWEANLDNILGPTDPLLHNNSFVFLSSHILFFILHQKSFFLAASCASIVGTYKHISMHATSKNLLTNWLLLVHR